MIRSFVGLCGVGMGLVLATGCGGGNGGAASAPGTATTKRPTTVTATERTNTATAPGGKTETSTSPEQQPGGAGDEVPARSQALLTGRGGRVRPRVVRVPSFIAIRVELRSADGATYALRFGNRTLKVDRKVGSISANFAGLRPGKALVGQPVGGGNAVRVEATAEPGP